ncbi:hypothetical protein DL93DRAFT_2090372 [Clavulina sp. PMI_390]|nr:hypothetical protein DL93DRAFT_2090372 [Clavulina sp. PMI_390]
MDLSFPPTRSSFYARADTTTTSSASSATTSKPFLGYTPSNPLSAIGIICFAAAAAGLTYGLIRGRWRARYMLAMVIGAYTITAGFVMRFPLRSNPNSEGIYILEDLLILLSPCAFIATEYSLLGRQALLTGTDEFLIVKASLLAKLFVGSDVATFLIQAGGGSMSISKNASTQKLGANLFKIGIILQFASFALFCLVLAFWLSRVHKKAPHVWNISEGAGWREDWKSVAYAQLLSCACILIRSIYRTASGLQGYRGSLATSQAAFYIFDSLPCFIAIGVYVIVWPGNYIDPDRIAKGGYGTEALKGGYAPSRENLNTA